ncbi:carbohydrate kinase [Paracoccus caeni]|uniref:Carbohydrate kinase n=1 Tax=Paracoccus caeni TaxID=657651 RepID=A0A934VZW2_9RHOB|nr:FGGY-family carbohydrate kinase [Paracoccus caeni]MBK4215219.1 carbohydrate kinase [Paracoccus caeni]
MLFAAVDVGSARVRAGLFASDGTLLARASRGFSLIAGPSGQATHDFAEIWQGVADSLAEARRMAGAAPSQISSLAFDATCSLVVDAPGFSPDVIAWHDHRAHAEAAELSQIAHEVVTRAGGSVSPEMQTPKLMWLVRHHPEIWVNLRSVRDLCDHLAWRATGIEARSLCAVAAKWAYLPDRGGWQDDLLIQTGIQNFPRDGQILPPGSRIGPLSERGAAELGLDRETLVAAGLIDAFAGALGAAPGMPTLIAGTSNCVMARNISPGRGIWGPYPGAIMPGEQVSEAGQSATGALLETIRQLYPEPQTHDAILARIGTAPDHDEKLHLLPDFKGSRTPFADPLIRGVAHGLSLDRNPRSLDRLYWRAAVGIALGTRQVIRHMGLAPERLAMAGGQARSALMRQTYADTTGAEIHWQSEDAVLRGSAIAAAAPLIGGIQAARAAFARPLTVTTPNPAQSARRERDWHIFLRMQQHREEIARM